MLTSKQSGASKSTATKKTDRPSSTAAAAKRRDAESESESSDSEDSVSGSSSDSDSDSDSDWSESGSGSGSSSDEDEEAGVRVQSSMRHLPPRRPLSLAQRTQLSLKMAGQLILAPIIAPCSSCLTSMRQWTQHHFPSLFKRGQVLFLHLRSRLTARHLFFFTLLKLSFVLALLYWSSDSSLPTPYGRALPGVGVVVSKEEAAALAEGRASKLDLPFGGHVAFRPSGRENNANGNGNAGMVGAAGPAPLDPSSSSPPSGGSSSVSFFSGGLPAGVGVMSYDAAQGMGMGAGAAGPPPPLPSAQSDSSSSPTSSLLPPRSRSSAASTYSSPFHPTSPTSAFLSPLTQPNWQHAKARTYSHLWCLGGKGKMGTHRERSCRFQNICYRLADRQWRYFVDPSEASSPLILQHGRMRPDFPSKFLSLGSRSPVPILLDLAAQKQRRMAKAAAAGELIDQTQRADVYQYGAARAPDSLVTSGQGNKGLNPHHRAEYVVQYDAGPWFSPARVMDHSIPHEWFVAPPAKNKEKTTQNTARKEQYKGNNAAATNEGNGGEESHLTPADLYVYYAPIDPISPSRLFARDLLPLFHLLRSFDLLHPSRSIQLLLPYDCEQLYAHPQYDSDLGAILAGEYTDEENARIQLCELMHSSMLLPGFTTRKPLTLSNLAKHRQKMQEKLGWNPTTLSAAALAKANGAANGGKTTTSAAAAAAAPSSSSDLSGAHICFDNLVLGLGPWSGSSVNSYQNARSNLPAFREFRQFYLENLLKNSQQQPPPTTHKITIISHPGSTAPLAYPTVVNYAELMQHLRDMYSTLGSSAPQIELIDLHALGWSESVRRIQATTILICYGSEEDVVALFLPKRAAVIIIDLSAPIAAAESTHPLSNITLSVPSSAASPFAALNRMVLMERSESGEFISSPPNENTVPPSLAEHSAVDPAIQEAQREKFPPAGANMLAHLGLFRTIHYAVSKNEISETTQANEGGVETLSWKIKINLKKMALLVDAAKQHVETFMI